MSAKTPLGTTYHTIEYADRTAAALHEVTGLLERSQEDPAKGESLLIILSALVYSLTQSLHRAKETLGPEALKELERFRPVKAKTLND